MSWGICIYCGKGGVSLSDEHVVPYAIGGRNSLVLKDASCESCAVITSKFERNVMRGLWGDARIAFDAPTRRPARRKKHLPMPSWGGRDSIAIPASEYPAGFVFYIMDVAGILRGFSEDKDVSGGWQMEVITDDERQKRFLAKHIGRELGLSFRHVPDDFARMIVKIGYGQVVERLTPWIDFLPFCTPYILGSKTNVSFIVGTNPERQPPTPNEGYVLRTVGVGSFDRFTLLASVRLLSNAHTPTYHVVVGEVVGAGRVQVALRKLGDTEAIPLQEDDSFPSNLF